MRTGLWKPLELEPEPEPEPEPERAPGKGHGEGWSWGLSFGQDVPDGVGWMLIKETTLFPDKADVAPVWVTMRKKCFLLERRPEYSMASWTSEKAAG